DLRSLVRCRSEELLKTADFASSMAAILAETRSHPTDFFHEDQRVAPLAKLAKATFHEADRGRNRWMFQDVLLDGPAHKGGVKSGAILLGVNGVNGYEDELKRIPTAESSTIHFQNPSSPPSSFTIEPISSGANRKGDTIRYLNYSKPEPKLGY